MGKGNNTEDLMGLIELAENASSKIDRLKLTKYSLVIVLILFTLVTFLQTYNLFNNNQNSPISLQEFFFIILIISAVVVMSGFFILLKIKKLMNAELRALDKLYHLIDPLKLQVRDDVSIMKIAAIEIRLNRINFGNYDPEKNKPLRYKKLQSLRKLQKDFV